MRLLLSLLCAACAALALLPATASAEKCTSLRKGVKRCEAVKKQTCKSGNPTVCRRSRSVCELHKSGFFRCRYVAKLAKCRGFNGRRCQTTWTKCESNPQRKRCTTNQLESCRSRNGARKCIKKFDDCTTRPKGVYSCVNTYTQRDCPKEGPCSVFRKTCRSRNGQSRASCEAIKYVESEAEADAGPGAEPPPAEPPPAEAPPAEPAPATEPEA